MALRWNCGGCGDGCGGSGGFFSLHAKVVGGWFHESFPACFFVLFFISNFAFGGDQFICIDATLWAMDQFALAQQTEMPADKHSLRSCVWIHFPDGFPLFFSFLNFLF